ncbi:MAG: YbjN domain-containing protein [Thermoguttaceae bacterium]|nr:YbjN domain-containing protein [Thermoguttaceae bacterium]
MEQTLKELAKSYLLDKGVNFRDVDERRLRVGFRGENLKLIEIFIRFPEEEGHDFIITSFSIGCSFTGELYNDGLELCNELNNEYRWVKFYLNDEHDVVAEFDAYIDENSCGPVVANAIRRMVSAMDKVYPRFMALRWG